VLGIPTHLGTASMDLSAYIQLAKFSKMIREEKIPLKTATTHLGEVAMGTEWMATRYRKASAAKAQIEGNRPMKDIEVAAIKGMCINTFFTSRI